MPAPLSRYTAQAIVSSPLGDIRLARTDSGLAGAWFIHGTKDHPALLPDVAMSPEDTLLLQAAQQFERYWLGQATSFEVPLDLVGTPFQRAVWQALLEIPFGATRTYGDIARHIGQPKASQAVGMAVGANPLIVIVPCHRIIGRDARLTGFSSGLPRKIDLLQREGLTVEGEFVRLPDAQQPTLFDDASGARA
ncbi:MAG TPA: methylated-DNA--[protein]-cysteine S-methyltransferase [Candidatus Aquabacterium excrementipullorum]|nr:methylated-DNA--[protein]-cysteine S-methyltransferase [Candidatus Aquabacterium excrementipullorum]